MESQKVVFPKLSRTMFWLAPILAIGIATACFLGGLPKPASLCLAVAILCASWWIFECVHLAIVGLIPFAAFPMLGVVSHKQIANAYGHTMILLLFAGFLLSAGMEKSGAHRRIALGMVRAVGGRGGRRLVLGFMLATALLSMWISNTAATLMILPIAMAVLTQAEDPTLRTPLLLGIAYSASIGGMSTPIGTPANVIFMGFVEERFDLDVSFFGWMKIAIPIVALLIPVVWWWVTRPVGGGKEIDMPETGAWRPSEIRVLAIFGITAVAWMTRTGPYGGWSSLLPFDPKMVGDSTVALIASLALFVVPSGEPRESLESPDGTLTKIENHLSPRLLDWSTAQNIQWGILLMFGGGLALAMGFEETGLSQAIGSRLTIFNQAPPWMVILSVCLLMTFLTEITSSTATATLMMPILAELAVATGNSPESILIPGTISASCAFMLPVATAPNVIVFGAGGIRTEEMARTGLALNFYAAGVITAVVYLV
ncbi:MAG: SLC13 family permease [Planctomycetota bacterium]